MIIQNTEKRTDNPLIYPNRYRCAKLTAFCVAQECQENWIGDVLDFSADGYKYWKGFYLKEILYYANEAVDYSTKPIKWKEY